MSASALTSGRILVWAQAWDWLVAKGKTHAIAVTTASVDIEVEGLNFMGKFISNYSDSKPLVWM